VVFDPRGRERCRFDLQPTPGPPGEPEQAGLWGLDLDGDGKDELLYLNGGEGQARRGDGPPLGGWALPRRGGPGAPLPPPARRPRGSRPRSWGGRRATVTASTAAPAGRAGGRTAPSRGSTSAAAWGSGRGCWRPPAPRRRGPRSCSRKAPSPSACPPSPWTR